MDNTYNLKSLIKFITHRNKIYSFFLDLKENNFNVELDKLILMLDKMKNNTNKFLNVLNYYNLKLTIKDFNIIFIIKFHSKEILPFNTENRNEVLECVDKVFEHINNFNPYDRFCVLKTINRFKRFNYEFNKWKEIDKRELVKDLASEYYRLENIKNEFSEKEEDKLYLDELQKLKDVEGEQNNILDKIKKIDGLNIFKQLKPMEVEYDKESINKIKKIIEDQYWKLLQEDLKVYPPDTKHLLLLIDEIKDVIYLLLKNRLDILIDLEKNVSVKELKNKFDTHYFIKALDYLLELLKMLQSPEYDELTDSKHKILKSAMIEGDSLDEFVPQIIKYILDGFYVVLIEKNEAIRKFNEWKEKKKNENI
jgi:hypothetical protein